MLFSNSIPNLRKYKWFFSLLWVIFLALGLLVIFNIKSIDIFTADIRVVKPYFIWPMLIGCILNWGIEIKKWHVINSEGNLSWNNAIKGVLAGITTSLFFPLRTGGFLGRFFYANHISKTTLTKHLLLTNLCQQLVTIVLGVTALIALHKTSVIRIEGWVFFGLLIVLFAIIAIWWRDKILFLFVKHALTQIIFSTTRYLVFSAQLIMAFQLFEVNLNIHECLFIPVYWLLISVIPVSFFGGLLVRETVGASVFGVWLGYYEPAIVVALFVLWFINVFLPALIGYAFWFKSMRKC